MVVRMTTVVIVAFAAVAVASLLAMVVLVVAGLRAIERITGSFSEQMRRVNAAVLIKGGVEPHHADPETFAPKGVSFDAVRREQEQIERESDLATLQAVEREARELKDADDYFRKAGLKPAADMDALAKSIEERLEAACKAAEAKA